MFATDSLFKRSELNINFKWFWCRCCSWTGVNVRWWWWWSATMHRLINWQFLKCAFCVSNRCLIDWNPLLMMNRLHKRLNKSHRLLLSSNPALTNPILLQCRHYSWLAEKTLCSLIKNKTFINSYLSQHVELDEMFDSTDCNYTQIEPKW